MVDAVNNPIKPQSGETLDLTGQVISVDATTVNSVYAPIQIVGVSDVTLIGGTIIGDRHLRPDDPNLGGLGHGIIIGGGASNIKIIGTTVQDCFGDGILIWGGNGVELDNVTSNHNRRQGVSIVNSNGVYIHDGVLSNNGGTSPGDGIDIENDLETETCANILIQNNTFSGNQGSGVGAGSPGTYTNIKVLGNSFDKTTQPIWVAGNAGSAGTPWWAAALRAIFGWTPSYRWWGYPTEWIKQ